MFLSDYLNPASIVADMKSTDKDGALAELVDALCGGFPDAAGSNRLHRESVLAVLRKRELLGSTGIGDGVAIPHGKDGSRSEISVAIGRSLTGCDFDAVDGKKCHVFCLLLAPDSACAGHLSLLAYLAKTLKSYEFRKRFMEAEDSAVIWRLINSTWKE